jgi:hypothetical protein
MNNEHAQMMKWMNGRNIRRCNQKFPDWVDSETNNNKHSRSNTKDYGGKTHYTDSQNSDTTAYSGRELYHLQFLLQAAGPETFGYTLIQYSTRLYMSWYIFNHVMN